MKSRSKETAENNTGISVIRKRIIYIYPYAITSYKNISVMRTFFSTPDDVLIIDFLCSLLL